MTAKEQSTKKQIQFNDQPDVEMSDNLSDDEDEWEDYENVPINDNMQHDGKPVINTKEPAFQDENILEEANQIIQRHTHKKATIAPKKFNPLDWSLAKFEIGKPLARGKYGHCLLVRDHKYKQIYVLKMLYLSQLQTNSRYL